MRTHMQNRHTGVLAERRYEALNSYLQMDIPWRGWLAWVTAADQEPCLSQCVFLCVLLFIFFKLMVLNIRILNRNSTYTLILLSVTLTLYSAPDASSLHQPLIQSGSRWLIGLYRNNCVSKLFNDGIGSQSNHSRSAANWSSFGSGS